MPSFDLLCYSFIVGEKRSPRKTNQIEVSEVKNYIELVVSLINGHTKRRTLTDKRLCTGGILVKFHREFLASLQISLWIWTVLNRHLKSISPFTTNPFANNFSFHKCEGEQNIEKACDMYFIIYHTTTSSYKGQPTSFLVLSLSKSLCRFTNIIVISLLSGIIRQAQKNTKIDVENKPANMNFPKAIFR